MAEKKQGKSLRLASSLDTVNTLEIYDSRRFWGGLVLKSCKNYIAVPTNLKTDTIRVE